MGIQEKIAEIQLEMARTQKNKATEVNALVVNIIYWAMYLIRCVVQGHLGLLKAKLAKLRTQLLEPTVSLNLKHSFGTLILIFSIASRDRPNAQVP